MDRERERARPRKKAGAKRIEAEQSSRGGRQAWPGTAGGSLPRSKRPGQARWVSEWRPCPGGEGGGQRAAAAAGQQVGEIMAGRKKGESEARGHASPPSCS